MAALSTEAINRVMSKLMSDSDFTKDVPFIKSQLRTGVVNADGTSADAEVAFVLTIPAGPKRNWVINNPDRGRTLLLAVMEERRKENP